jgi:hypothetical protein
MNQAKANAFLQEYRERVSESIHGCVLIYENGIDDLNKAYFRLQDAHTEMLKQLEQEKIIPKGYLNFEEPSGEGSAFGDIKINKFWYQGFPRMIPEMHKIRAVFLLLEMRQGNLCTLVRVAFEDGKHITYQSSTSS